MKRIRCLGFGWAAEVEELPLRSFRCQYFPSDHDYRYMWVVPDEETLRSTHDVVHAMFSSIQNLALRIAEKLPPCHMDGLPLGDIHDSIIDTVGTAVEPQAVIDLLINGAYIECLMIGRDPAFTNWREFRVIFNGYPHCMLP